MASRLTRWGSVGAAVVLGLVAGDSAEVARRGAAASDSPIRHLAPSRVAPAPDDEPLERMEYHWRRRSASGRALPFAFYERARHAMESMPHRSSVLGQEFGDAAQAAAAGADKAMVSGWRHLGPTNVGGRTRALILAPGNSRLLYAAGVAGGVWKSTDGSASWRPTALMGNLAVSTLAIDPTRPEVVYAGTGERFGNSDGVRGGGVFKSVDGGDHWLALTMTTPPAQPTPGDPREDFAYVHKLLVSQADPRRVYAGTSGGIHRSLDAGATWEKVFGNRPPRPIGASCSDLAIARQGANDVLFASCAGGSTQGVVIRNPRAQLGGGADWAAEVVIEDVRQGRASLAIAPSNPSIVYLMAAGTPGPPAYTGGLYRVMRSDRGGVAGSFRVVSSWDDSIYLDTFLLSNPLFGHLMECGLGFSNARINQGFYDNVLAVDPVDPDIVYAGGIDLFRSDNGGKTWGLIGYWWANDVVEGPPPPSYLHADQHQIVFHPRFDGKRNQTLFVANDGGIFRTRNARAKAARGLEVCDYRATAVAWQSLNNGYSTVQFYHGAAYPNGSRYLGGTQDNGTLAGPGGGSWTELLGGDGGYVAVDPRDTDVLYAETTRLSLRRSDDGGETWERKVDGIGETSSTVSFIVPFAMDPSDPDRILLGGGSRVWLTEDRGETWDLLARLANHNLDLDGEPTTQPLPVTAVALRGGTWLAATAGFRAGISRGSDVVVNGRATRLYHQEEGLQFHTYISSLAVHPTDPNTFFATSSLVEDRDGRPVPSATAHSRHVWKTIDAGAHWSPIDGEGAGVLPDIPVHSIAVDPKDPDRMFIGTDLGILSSVDGGRSWAVELTGFPNTVTEALSLRESPAGRYLVAFTHGRGAWEGKLVD